MGERKLIVPGRYDRLETVCNLVAQSAEEAGLDDSEQFHCQIAVDEACTNIIEHAYGGEDRGEIEVACHASPGELVITLVDQGREFDPQSVPAPQMPVTVEDLNVGGLGLFFMRKVMDEVRFTSDDTGNRLVMVKRGAPRVSP